ncbi:MAG TPA: hypothetical protein DC049_17455 [Spirochaetia bacterium]|nr:hypothetical protein [Spirochaetia bacterium]
MRSIFTVYGIFEFFPQTRVLIELFHENKISLLSGIQGKCEILTREMMDARLALSSLRSGKLSPVLYDIFDAQKNLISETSLAQLGIGKAVSWGQIMKFGLEKRMAFFGMIDPLTREYELAPSAQKTINPASRLFYIEKSEEPV